MARVFALDRGVSMRDEKKNVPRATEFLNILNPCFSTLRPLKVAVTYMNTKSPARFYEALHIYEHVQNDDDDEAEDDDDDNDDGNKRREGSLRAETFIIHRPRHHRFELIRRRSFAGQIKIIHCINLISLYGRSALYRWQVFQFRAGKRLVLFCKRCVNCGGKVFLRFRKSLQEISLQIILPRHCRK